MINKSSQGGFTLIELMIVVVIVGILSAIAYPSFSEYIAKGRRAEAKTTLMGGQQWMERFYTENYRYDKNSAGTVDVIDIFPAHLKKSPIDGSEVYSIAPVVTADIRDVYSLKALRKVGATMASDKCGDFLLDQYGRKDLQNYSTTSFSSKKAALEYCWK